MSFEVSPTSGLSLPTGSAAGRYNRTVLPVPAFLKEWPLAGSPRSSSEVLNKAHGGPAANKPTPDCPQLVRKKHVSRHIGAVEAC